VAANYDPLIGKLVQCFEDIAYRTPAALLPKQGVLKWASNRRTLAKLAKLNGQDPADPRFSGCYWKAYALFRQRFDPRRSLATTDIELREVRKQEEEDWKSAEDNLKAVYEQEKRRYGREVRKWVSNGRKGPRPQRPIELDEASMKFSGPHTLPLPLDMLE